MEEAEITLVVHVGDHLVRHAVQEDVELAAMGEVEFVEINPLVDGSVLVGVEGQADYSAVLIEVLAVVKPAIMVGVVGSLLGGITDKQSVVLSWEELLGGTTSGGG
ncbi:unnamed protein product [marine sediment metagenome]|uniref:Uncharacterized protein n=1 Tax=marine sediment metagenome TaxID=412755 RepID=X0SUG3_9ZZZZ